MLAHFHCSVEDGAEGARLEVWGPVETSQRQCYGGFIVNDGLNYFPGLK